MAFFAIFVLFEVSTIMGSSLILSENVSQPFCCAGCRSFLAKVPRVLNSTTGLKTNLEVWAVKKENANMITGMLAGAAVGVVSALLLTPMKGSETRRRVKERLGQTVGTAQSVTGKAVGSAQSFAERAREKASSVASHAEQRAGTVTTQVIQQVRGQHPKQNLNRVTLDELVKLEDVTPDVAGKIMDYRHQRGGFRSVDELEHIPGINKHTVELLKDEFYV
jgi:DNA uptake protein ComE-like DNA-binding protein